MIPIIIEIVGHKDISKAGKFYRYTNCGQEKIIHSELFSEKSDIHSRYCKDCTALLNENVKCKFCNEEIRQKSLPKHVSDYHIN